MSIHNMLITLHESQDLGKEKDTIWYVCIYLNKLCILINVWCFFLPFFFFVMSATLQSYVCADELCNTAAWSPSYSMMYLTRHISVLLLVAVLEFGLGYTEQSQLLSNCPERQRLHLNPTLCSWVSLPVEEKPESD